MINLSIIIPHYNDFDRLCRLLDSIPNNKNIEILIIDDNSDSNQFDNEILIKKYHYKNVTVLINYKDNRGAGVCRNIGIDNAIGKWVLFADSDDFFTDNFYDLVNQYFKTNFEIVFFFPTSLDEIMGGTSDRHKSYADILKKNLRNQRKWILDLKYNFHVPWSKLFQRSFIINNNIRFEESLASNDVLFSTYSGFYLKDYYINENPIYVVTKNKGSLTQNTSIEIHKARLKTTIKREKFLKNVLSNSEYKKVRASGRIFLLNTLIYKMGFREFLKTYSILKKNNIVIFELNLLNPLILMRKIYVQLKRTITGKKYRV